MLTSRTIPGGWREQTVTVAEHTFQLLLPADPDQVFYHLEYHPEAASELGDDPYWAQLWPTSLRLAECILKTKWTLPARAIELGCGVGLTGLAALAAGMQVTFSDYNPLAVELAVENARCNGFESSGLVLDWRDPPRQPFDVLLASDVIYDRKLHAPLLGTLESLTTPASIVWVGDGGRSATEEFVALARQDWNITMLDLVGRPNNEIHVGEYRRLIFRPLADAAR